MKKQRFSLLYILALGIVVLAGGCGQTAKTMQAMVMFGNPSSGPTTNPGGGSIAADSTAPPKPAASNVDTTSKTATQKQDQLLKTKNSVSCIGEGMCSNPALGTTSVNGTIPVTFSYSTQTPSSISLIFKLADIVTYQPTQQGNLVDGGQYTFGTPITLDDPMYGQLGIQGTMMIPAAQPGTVKNDGNTVTITMPLVPATASGPATTGQ